MASPPSYGAHGTPFDDMATAFASTAPQVPPQNTADPSQPPSPNGISAATILATLSDNRPPTAQDDEDHDGELDDAFSGGIALAGHEQDDVASFPFLYPSNITVPHGVEQSNFVQYEIPMAAYESMMHEIGMQLHSSIGQHAAALESLTMSQTPTPASLAPSIADSLLTLPSTVAPSSLHIPQIQLEADAYYEDNWTGVQNKDNFLNISAFYRHFVNHPKDAVLLGLEGADRPPFITRDDLRGDNCDYQGIDWSLRRTTREAIRSKRTAFESHRMPGRLKAIRSNIAPMVDSADAFSFRRMNNRHHAFIHHFQLRNLLAATSRNDVFYATGDQVNRTDASGTLDFDNVVMDLSKELTDGYRFSITTLAASDNLLIAGGFEGEYAITNLCSTYDTKYTIGRITDRSQSAKSHITNHMHLYNSRNNNTPQVALCSNDERLRILDCYTNTFTHSFRYPLAVNCSATSPNGRMRVVVGDFFETLITNAETGRPFETLRTHSDGVFACDWADDGIHVATAAQDTSIVIWDARNWSLPLRVLRSELSVPRCLKFSPVGGGPRVLVSAEADDYISIIDAQTYDSRQIFDYFGHTAGISMTPDGSSLFAAAVDPHFSGIIELERCGRGENRSIKESSDWLNEDEMEVDTRAVCGWRERQRRGLELNLGEIYV